MIPIFSKDTFGRYLTNADNTLYYNYFEEALDKLKYCDSVVTTTTLCVGTLKTLEVFEKLGNYINAHMDDSGWKDLIKTTKHLVKSCQDIMKSKGEGFESFRWRISRLFWPLMTQITWPWIEQRYNMFHSKKESILKTNIQSGQWVTLKRLKYA